MNTTRLRDVLVGFRSLQTSRARKRVIFVHDDPDGETMVPEVQQLTRPPNSP